MSFIKVSIVSVYVSSKIPPSSSSSKVFLNGDGWVSNSLSCTRYAQSFISGLLILYLRIGHENIAVSYTHLRAHETDS